jgi:uncharacterized protein YidB (DUF937 family)
MGILEGLVEGMVGAEMVNVVNGLIAKHGGVQGVMGQLQAGGLGPTVNSWMAGNTAAPISPSEVHSAFGNETMSELAARSGMTPQELAAKLATVLPHAVNTLAPGATPAATPSMGVPPPRQ